MHCDSAREKKKQLCTVKLPVFGDSQTGRFYTDSGLLRYLPTLNYWTVPSPDLKDRSTVRRPQKQIDFDDVVRSRADQGQHPEIFPNAMHIYNDPLRLDPSVISFALFICFYIRDPGTKDYRQGSNGSLHVTDVRR